MLRLTDITRWLDELLQVGQYPDEPNGIYVPSTRSIARVGLALEPWAGLPEWLQQNQIDTLFLHRPWQLQKDRLPENVGVFAYHLAFDEHLTIGYNPILAKALAMQSITVFGEKAGRPLGMMGKVPLKPFSVFVQEIGDQFGGLETTQPGRSEIVRKIAVVGAMTEELVYQAAQQDADLYVTGQFRKPAAAAITETGISVIAVGHRRSELWGLQALADLLKEQFGEITTLIYAL